MRGLKYFEELESAVSNRSLRIGAERYVKGYRKIFESARRYPRLTSLAEEVRVIKEDSVSRMEELAKQLADSFRENGGEAHIARTREEALRVIGDLVRPGDIVVKGKSMTCEEIGLREFLSEKGAEVWETDLGEFIVQLAGIRPMHPVNPAAGVSREEVFRLFEEKLGVKLSGDVAEAVEAARRFLRGKYVNADVGISGGNVAAAEEGIILTVENEGNIRLSTTLPRRYVIVLGMEKIVPTIEDAIKVLKVTWRYAGYKAPTYINAVSGPSKTGDIEKVIVYGAHGPKEVHLVILDNGRTAMLRSDAFREALYCLRCGACAYECPLFPLVGGYFGYKYVSGIGAVWTAFTISEEIGLCVALTCVRAGRCREVCPLRIDIPGMVVKLRERLFKKFGGRIFGEARA